MIGPCDDPSSSSASVRITVGTAEQKDISAGHYIVDPLPPLTEPWKMVPFPEDATRVIKLQPIQLESRNGTSTLYERIDHTTGCIVNLSNPMSGRQATIRILTTSVGTARGLVAHFNPWGYAY